MEYQQPYVQYDPRDVQQTKSIAWLSYLGILFLIPMFVYKESPYTKFHVNQGIVLCILDVAGGIVLGIVSAVLGWIPFVGWIISGLLSLAFGVFVLVLMILGIVNARKKELCYNTLIAKTDIGQSRCGIFGLRPGWRPVSLVKRGYYENSGRC